ncbi:MAG TPA: glutamate-5-semialdehyde dehydrogenase, partial [Candidatus Eisenbacteria bacterium]|nr:glutamate-5-semialdehyde dehydrogenase [Candidatus Eisenbacteria bacterium]
MIKDLCKNAKSAKAAMSVLPTIKKNKILMAVADGLIKEQDSIIAANAIDLEEGKKNGLSEALLDRLTLTEARIEAMAESLLTIAGFPDPIGEIVEGFNTESGLKIEKVRSALGVVAIIYESRPNVTIDAAGLCLKASNVAILRGSSAAIHSNKVLADLFRRIGQANGMPDYAVQLVEDVSHERLDELIKEDAYIDVLIPRGGEGLKQAMKEKSSIPIIMTGAGTCHIYVDESAVEEQAIPIILNAKTQRPGTCNSVECVLLHKNKIPFLAELVEELLENEVKVNLSKVLYDKLPDNL